MEFFVAAHFDVIGSFQMPPASLHGTGEREAVVLQKLLSGQWLQASLRDDGLDEYACLLHCDRLSKIIVARADRTPVARMQNTTVSTLSHFLRVRNGLVDPVCNVHGQITLAFLNEVRAAWDVLPEALQRYVVDTDYTIHLGSMMSDMVPDSRNKFCGLHDPVERKIYLAEFSTHRENPVACEETVARLIFDGAMFRSFDPANTLYHEIYHLISATWMLPEAVPLCRMQNISEAYSTDLAGLGGRKAARNIGYGYYVYNGEPDRLQGHGESEIFAELGAFALAERLGQRKLYQTCMKQEWPNSMSEMRLVTKKILAEAEAERRDRPVLQSACASVCCAL